MSTPTITPAQTDRPEPTASADVGEVVHQVCTTCWPNCFASDGERFALCGADMRGEREVATAGPGEPCEPCEAAASSHWHGGAR
ncbi:hypothetical protein ACQP60_04320 [Isoptericola variabilis]|uniref:hypothetical protein n=1 Tax=Isoptericola variabilis TaxID=139208 RepID=UPI003D1F6986